jgi:hypothetical protein
MAIELRDLIKELEAIAALFPEAGMPVFIQMGTTYCDCQKVEHGFHDDWQNRYPEGRHTVTLKG